MQLRPLLLAALLLAPVVARAELPSGEVFSEPPPSPALVTLEPHRSKNVVSLAPVSFLFGMVGLEYERALAKSLSITVSADYRWSSFAMESDAIPNGLSGLNVGAHVFLLGHAPSGLWLGPELGAWFGQLPTHDGDLMSWMLPRFALQLGYTGLVADILAISLGGGIQMIGPMILPNARMSIGFAF